MMLRHYCEEQNLSQNILQSVRQHYTFWYQENSPFEYEAELLSKMPPPLRKEVITYIHKHLFSSLALFRQPLPDWLQAVLVRMLEPQAYNAGELMMHPSEARLPQDLSFIHEGSCEAYLYTLGTVVSIAHPSKKPGKENQSASKVAQAPEDSLDPLEVYGPGSVIGIEPLLGEEAMQAFGLPVHFLVRATPSGVCRTFSLRTQVLVEAARANPHMASLLKEVMSQTVIQEGKRRINARHSGRVEFYRRIEAALAAQASYVAVADIDSPGLVFPITRKPAPSTSPTLVSAGTVSPGRVQPPVARIAPAPAGEPPEASIRNSPTVASLTHIAQGYGDGTGGDFSGKT